LSHATGHKSRLDRGLGERLAPFGSPDYSREELVAEMGAAFLCAHAGIEPATLSNSGAYVASWIKVLKGDNRPLVNAAEAAQRAVDFILGRPIGYSPWPHLWGADGSGVAVCEV
jgi:antirestriction protein ArdC